MNHKHDTASQQDRELSRRFGQMRQADAERVPDFPREDELAERNPIVAGQRYSSVQKFAVAATVIVTLSVLMTRPPAQDPGALYADIINANSIKTDQLMLVSEGVLPEMTSMPDVYDIDLPIGRAEITN